MNKFTGNYFATLNCSKAKFSGIYIQIHQTTVRCTVFMIIQYSLYSTFNIGIYGVGSKRQLISEFLDFLRKTPAANSANACSESNTSTTPKKSKRTNHNHHTPKQVKDSCLDVFTVWPSATYLQLDGFDASLTPISVLQILFYFNSFYPFDTLITSLCIDIFTH